jgi:hypothetical protein
MRPQIGQVGSFLTCLFANRPRFSYHDPDSAPKGNLGGRADPITAFGKSPFHPGAINELLKDRLTYLIDILGYDTRYVLLASAEGRMREDNRGFRGSVAHRRHA